MGILISLLCAVIATATPQKPDLPRVYVFTARAASDLMTEEEQGRIDSVKDVQEALRHHSKRIAFAPDVDSAQVVVEVLSRERSEGGSGGYGGASVTHLGKTTIRLRLRYGERETEIRGVSQGYWSKAAKDAADRAVKWILR